MGTISFSEYKGHKLIVIGEATDKYPFQFGIGKAKKLIAVMNELGADRLKGMLEDFVRKNENAESGE